MAKSAIVVRTTSSGGSCLFVGVLLAVGISVLAAVCFGVFLTTLRWLFGIELL